MENDLHTFSFCREDWNLIVGALRALSVDRVQSAHEVGPDSIYGAACLNEAGIMQALASDIEFKLPD